MAIYHLEANIISRAQGRSSVAAAAYRATEKLHDERTDITHDYTKKSDLLHSEILLPKNAPEWMGDRSRLWNAVEYSEKRKDAQLSREFNIALPKELTDMQRIELAREFVQKEFVDRGMVADLCLHTGHKGMQDQPHMHVMLTLRKVTKNGFGLKDREWNQKALLEHWREAWANTCNKHLALHGHDIRIDHRTLEAQGIELEPQAKIGPKEAHARMVRLQEHQRIARENGDKIYNNPKIALHAITQQQSTFTHQDLARFINRHTVDAEQFKRVYEAVHSNKELVLLGRDDLGRERLTTLEMLEIESRLLHRSGELQNRTSHSVSKEARPNKLAEKNLSAEQKTALNHITDKGDLKCVIGYAGTGKSYLLGVARESWQASGYRVQGATLSGIAAENLEASSGIQSRTVASLLKSWEHGYNTLNNKDVLVIDEAGMVGSRQMAQLVDAVYNSGAKLVLIGDPEQLQAIQAGAAFRAIAEQVGYVELTEVRRQVTPWQQEATKEFATGQTEIAFNRYQEKGHVHAFDTDARAKTALLEQWNEVRLNQPEKTQIILTYTRADAKELNETARSLRQSNNELGQDSTIKTANGERNFAEQDRVYFLKNDREMNVKNGTLGTIEKISGNQMTIRLDKDERMPYRPGRVTVDTEHYNHLDHGYAATTHKGQGLTVDRSYILASPYMDRHAMYVAGSRHREGADIFYSREGFKNERDLINTLSRERAKDTTMDYQLESNKAYAFNRGIEQESPSTAQPFANREYEKMRELFNQDKGRQQTAIERLQARQETKALQTAYQELEKQYGKSISQEWQHGEKGIYRQTLSLGSQCYAVIEQEKNVKLVPYENDMETYKGKAVTICEEQDISKQTSRARLHANQERGIGGNGRGDYEISR